MVLLRQTLTLDGLRTTLAPMDEMTVPEWTLGWRLQRALHHAGMQTDQMAAELGLSRGTVSRWLNDRGAPPKLGYIKVWAMRCGVPLEWLITGESSANEPSLLYISQTPSDLRESGLEVAA